MRKFRILGAMVAVVALSAFAVAGASANVWLESGKEVTGSKSVNSTGTLEFHNVILGAEVTILCSGLFVGTVSPAGKDLVSEVKSLSGTEKNLVACESHSSSCGKAVLHAENLPWSTQLVGTPPTADNFSEDGKGEPAWLVLCEGLIKEVLCKKNAVASFVTNEASGAKFEYTKTGTVTTCSNGTEGWITGGGTVLGVTAS